MTTYYLVGDLVGVITPPTVSRDVTCPRCSAEPGSRCTTVDNSRWTGQRVPRTWPPYSHKARVDLVDQINVWWKQQLEQQEAA